LRNQGRREEARALLADLRVVHRGLRHGRSRSGAEAPR
jgi:hypothetical protein